MGLHLRFLSWRRPVDILEHVETIANLAGAEVLRRAQGTGSSMTANQRLGYVQVRADKVIRRHVMRLAILRSLDARTEQRVLDAAREQVVRSVCTQLELSKTARLPVAA
ncbi:MAG: hypothetical protein VB878_05505 [Pirellulaceae bacterium]|jgi:hypothetical protein|nr:hypothetical protein [Planctomycetaceae bacterium]HIM28286.1 hypothetical protein [Planctomycetota bacterium]